MPKTIALTTDEGVNREIAGWRYAELRRAGYDGRDALTLALERDVDLHAACDLLRNGCPPHLALRILR